MITWVLNAATVIAAVGLVLAIVLALAILIFIVADYSMERFWRGRE